MQEVTEKFKFACLKYTIRSICWNLVEKMFSKIREFLFFIYTHINQVSAQLKTTASDLFYDSLRSKSGISLQF